MFTLTLIGILIGMVGIFLGGVLVGARCVLGWGIQEEEDNPDFWEEQGE